MLYLYSNGTIKSNDFFLIIFKRGIFLKDSQTPKTISKLEG